MIPDPESFVSGGNRYNSELLTALKAAGKSVSVVSTESSSVAGQLWLDSIWMDQLNEMSVLPDGLIVHHLGSFYPETTAQSAEEELHLLSKVPRYLCTSPFTKERLLAYGFAAEACIVIEPGMHLAVPQTRTFPSTSGGLMVANLVPRKGVLPFLQALRKQMSDDQSFHLTIAGSHELNPDYASSCRELVKSSPGLTHSVTFLKDLTPDEMLTEYLTHSFLVSAAGMETYGMAIREAICLGLPVLCLNNSGYAHQHPGIYHASDSIEALVNDCLVAGSSAEFAQLQAEKWANRPEPVSWNDQAHLFIRHTESWIASR